MSHWHMCTAGQLGLVPNSSVLSGGGERITACSLYSDTSGLLAANSSADSDTNIICVVCRSARLELMSLPSMGFLLTIENISNGHAVVPAVTSAGVSSTHVSWRDQKIGLIFCLAI